MQQGLYSDMELIEALWEHTFKCARFLELGATGCPLLQCICLRKVYDSHGEILPAHRFKSAHAVFKWY